MREVHTDKITKVVRDLFMDSNCEIGDDLMAAYDRGIETDESPVAREVLKELKENVRIAHEERSPICQDTGLAVVFVDLGQDVHVVGGDFNGAINEGVRQ